MKDIQKDMTLSPKAKAGFEFAVNHIKVALDSGISPQEALEMIDVTEWQDTFHLMNYMRENGHEKLLKRFVKKANSI